MMMTTINFLTKGSLLEFGEIYTQHHRKGDKLFGLVFMVNQGFSGDKVSVEGEIIVELGNQFGNLSEIEEQDGNNGVAM